MKTTRTRNLMAAAVACLLAFATTLAQAGDALPSWNEGNSDGDLQMLQWTAAGGGARFMGIVHHTDAEREWAYNRNSHIGKLGTALDQAKAKGWTVVSMKDDWKTVFPPESSGR